MLKASAEYKQIMSLPIRNRSYISVSLGIVNQSAQGNAHTVSTLATWSKGNIFEESHDEDNTYATFEQNFIPCDGSMIFMPEVEQYKTNGIVLPNIGDSLRIEFDQLFDIKGLTIDFGVAYPTNFTVTTDNGSTTFTNDSQVFTTETVFGEVTYFVITPNTMLGGRQRLRIKSLLFGVGINFSNNVVERADIEQYVSPISEDSTYLNTDISVFDVENKFDVDNDSSFMQYLEPMQPIKISFGIDLGDGTQEWLQTTVAYLNEWKSSRGRLTFSGTGRLDQNEFVYSHNVLQTRTAYSEFEAMLQAAGLEPDEYNIDEYLMTIDIKNPIPEMSVKDGLQLLANACRCVVQENENSVISITGNFENIINPEDLEVHTDDETEWSNVENVVVGAQIEYADFSTNMTRVDDSIVRFMPEDPAEYLTTTGYVSQSLANDVGEFETNPYVDIELPAKYSYTGVTVTFGGQVPKEFIIRTYDGDTLLNSFTYTDITPVCTFSDDYRMFNKMRFEVAKTEPYARAVINKIGFGDTTDYALTYDLMMSNPNGYQEELVKKIRVKIYTYELNEDNEPELVDDDVWYEKQLNLKGVTKSCENPLIHSQEQAELLATWLGNYYKNNVSYDVSYRGEPRLRSTDIIRMDSRYKNNLEVAVLKNRLSFNGALSGELELRRALKLIEEDI